MNLFARSNPFAVLYAKRDALLSEAAERGTEAGLQGVPPQNYIALIEARLVTMSREHWPEPDAAIAVLEAEQARGETALALLRLRIAERDTMIVPRRARPGLAHAGTLLAIGVATFVAGGSMSRAQGGMDARAWPLFGAVGLLLGLLVLLAAPAQRSWRRTMANQADARAEKRLNRRQRQLGEELSRCRRVIAAREAWRLETTASIVKEYEAQRDRGLQARAIATLGEASHGRPMGMPVAFEEPGANHVNQHGAGAVANRKG